MNESTKPFILRVYEKAYETVAILANVMVDNNQNFLSKENLPLLKPLMFARLLMETDQAEADETWDSQIILETIENMIETGRYEEIINHQYYGIFNDAVDAYVEDTRHNMDEGRQVLAMVKEISGELMRFMNSLSENMDPTMVEQVEEFWNRVSGKLGLITDLLDDNTKLS